MRWDGQWTLGLFACAALLYWVNQLTTRPPATLLQSGGDADVDDIAAGRSDGLVLSGGRFQTFEGLPEEVRITEAALAEGFAVVALSSQDRKGNRCWDTAWPPEDTTDIPKVVWAVQALIKQEGWFELPLFALGASSGGAFALLLATRLQLQAVCCQIMSLPVDILQKQPHDDTDKTWKFPPTALVHMAKDKRTARGVRGMVAELQAQQVPVMEIVVRAQPLTPGFLANRTRDISQSVSAAIYSTLQKGEMLDKNDFLLQDPRQTSEHWQSLLRQHVAATREMNLKLDESTVHEELNLAWAGHELVSDNIRSVFGFFIANS